MLLKSSVFKIATGSLFMGILHMIIPITDVVGQFLFPIYLVPSCVIVAGFSELEQYKNETLEEHKANKKT